MSDAFSQKEMMLKMMVKLDETHDLLIKHMATEESQLNAIHAQALKTNGRVTKLEEDMSAVQVRQEGLATRVGTGVFIASTIFIYLVNRFL